MIEPRSSFVVEHGEVYQTHPRDPWARRRLYIARRGPGREGQRAKVRERIAETGCTSSDQAKKRIEARVSSDPLAAAKRELRQRITSRGRK